MEGFVREALSAHVNPLIAKEQHGFVPKKSCVTNLLETIDFVSELLAQGHCVDLIYLDFSKAFDSLMHALLLEILPSYGIDGGITKWIKSFLSDRRQRVVLGEQVSDWAAVTSGVPQGSVIGPLLFNLFINGLPKLIKSMSKLYADDSKILGKSDTAAERDIIQSDLNSIVEWTDRALLRLNFQKCKVMHLGKGNVKYDYTIHDSVTNQTYSLVKTTEEKDLGVTFSSDLKWNKHVDNITHKANTALRSLKNTFTCRDKKLWGKLYTSIVRPQMEYAAPVWNSDFKHNEKALEKVQHRATKVGQPKMTYEKRLVALGLTTHKERRLRGDCIETFKIINNLTNTTLKPSLNDSAHQTRRNSKALVRDRFAARAVNSHGPAVGFRHSFLLNRVVPEWNELSNYTVEAENVNNFKNRYDNAKKKTSLNNTNHSVQSI